MGQEILKTLLDEVSYATEAHHIAHAEFAATIASITGGWPEDSVRRVADASTACANARKRMRVARIRLEQFKSYGFIPKDLGVS